MISPKTPLMFPEEENSLSRIIREQGLRYQEDVFDLDIHLDFKSIVNAKKEKKDQKSLKINKLKSQPSEDNSPTKDSKSRDGQTKRAQKDQYLSPKAQSQSQRRDFSPYIQIRSAQKKRNIVDLSDGYSEQKLVKKQKKNKIMMDEQKTKKIQFQDLDRPKQQLMRKKQHSSTKIKQKMEQEQAIDTWKEGVLEISSNQSSDIKESGKISCLQQTINKNYKFLGEQIKQMMSIVKCQYIELEKIEIRKLLSKLEGQIRRMKIGFRGLSQSNSTENKGLSSKFVNKSKIKQQSQSKQKLRSSEQLLQKGYSYIEKQKSNNNQLSLKEYGFDLFQVQHSRDFQGPQSNKLRKLNQDIEKQKRLYAKEVSRYNELSIRYKNTKEEMELRAGESQFKDEIKVSQSMIKRSKILKEKLVFLKNQIKQTKLFYSNRIKRLKNQNSILYNETKYVEKQTLEIRTALNNQESYNKNVALAVQATIYKKASLEHSHEPKGHLVVSSATKTSASYREITAIKSIQSIQNIKSVQYINSYKQYHSNNKSEEYLPKPKKAESTDKQSRQYQMNQKHKLKINSPHIAPINNGGNIKQYSILTKRKRETQQRIGRSGQNSNSLDIAFKKLQQKYQIQVQQPNCEIDQYYGGK